MGTLSMVSRLEVPQGPRKEVLAHHHPHVTSGRQTESGPLASPATWGGGTEPISKPRAARSQGAEVLG